MKKLFATLLATLFLNFIPAHARDLSKEEQSYVAIALGTMAAANLCSGYTIVNGGLSKVGDRLGVSDDVGVAIFESIKMTMGQDYNRNVLIPEVTRFVNETVDNLAQVTADKKNYCNKFAPVLIAQGTIRKVEDGK
jgi:hypothetical protein